MAVETRSAAARKIRPLRPASPTSELQALLAECQQLRAEGQRIRIITKRLRLDCVKARLDLAERLLTIADPKVHGEKLASLYRSGALRSYKNLRDAILNPGWTGMDRQALESRLTRLQLLLADLGILDDAELQNCSSIQLQKDSARITDTCGRPDTLTKRETEVLTCVAEGLSTKLVAETLGITFKTAACHRYRIMDKLGIHDTASLVRYAIRNGFVRA